ncbi:hypothetical protein MAC_08671 [Metarhizium acridum CQMa 102]|uniref:DUF7079 domain-containing protein n=1 Tax=Metarhizium acridum (strain CQMa 102) TaxID=655827 RepID=E9EFM4_METAQ|nr:uncharacterized protein MAC_08671 [Metarhizium acridum CQMa 102]EFY85262.1 hypothetical protein MAC_08671 [Metarhizium acridum CQMa 102]
MSNTEPLTEAEKEACICLSTLFLDSEMTSAKIATMAQSLHRLRLPVQQLDNMLRHELFPILYPNLINPAGVWDGFDETDLIARVNDRRAHPQNLLQTLGNNVAWVMLRSSVMSSWARVRETLGQLDRDTSPKRPCSLALDRSSTR